jgi:D-glycero-D-manno-heptose 1,7-bisphosphate phosphatase
MNLNTKKKDLVILAGGRGDRIKRYLNNLPKPLITINNRPFLNYLIQFYCKFNINRIFILAGYKGYKIKKIFHKKILNFVEINCKIEKKPMDTFGALNSIKKKLNDFYLVNGDSFLDIDLNLLKLKRNKIATISLIKNKNYLSNKKLNELSINKKEDLIFKKNSKLMNAGIYLFKKKILRYLNNKKQSLEMEIIPKLIKENNITGKIFTGEIIDIGTKKNLKYIKKNFSKFFKKPAVFLDRDGVINYDKGYTYKIKKYKFKSGVILGLKKIIKKNYNLFLVTNQAGIAKGKFTINQFIKLQKYIKEKLNSHGVFFSDVKYCPYHPDASIKKYRKNSFYRKPGNGMLKEIFKEWIINKKQSFMIGDSKTDYQCAKKSGIKFYYTQNNFCKLIINIFKKNA